MENNSVQYGKLRGSIKSSLTLIGNIRSNVSLNGVISKPTFIGGEEYKGAYEVTPKVEAQTLPTKDKMLIDDMTVKGIEIHRVKNSSGGITVYIAKGV